MSIRVLGASSGSIVEIERLPLAARTGLYTGNADAAGARARVNAGDCFQGSIAFSILGASGGDQWFFALLNKSNTRVAHITRVLLAANANNTSGEAFKHRMDLRKIASSSNFSSTVTPLTPLSRNGGVSPLLACQDISDVFTGFVAPSSSSPAIARLRFPGAAIEVTNFLDASIDLRFNEARGFQPVQIKQNEGVGLNVRAGLGLSASVHMRGTIEWYEEPA